jgi:hypothetical protein
VAHIDRTKQRLVYTNFEDELGAGAQVDLPQLGAVDFIRFKRKARHLLLEHDDNLTLQKLRRGRPMTKLDLDQLAALLIDAEVGDRSQIDKAAEVSQGFGRFVRSLVGLERAAVAEALSSFISSGNPTARQIDFIELVIEHLTEKGARWTRACSTRARSRILHRADRSKFSTWNEQKTPRGRDFSHKPNGERIGPCSSGGGAPAQSSDRRVRTVQGSRGVSLEPIPHALHGLGDLRLAQLRRTFITVKRTTLVNGSTCSSHAFSSSCSAEATPPSARISSSSTANSLRDSSTGCSPRMTVRRWVSRRMPARSRTGGDGRPGAAGERPDAANKFGKGKRLGEIVVGPEAEARDALRHGCRCREHQYAGLQVRPDQRRADLVARQERQIAVEHEHVVVVDAGPFEAPSPS